ncbi:MAG: response regulator [Zetaproteobacteria bacterium]|nr:response regulator [Zetaproteobacteria bacterium]
MRKRVLVVDDNRSVAELIKRLLESHGYAAEVALRGEDALKQLQLFVPDLMTVDIEMPDMDGFTLCQQVREDTQWCDLPILLISGSDPVQSRRRGFEVGAIDFISKPFENKELVYAVDKILHTDEQFKQLKVIVVDDNRMIRLVCMQILHSLGVEVKGFESGVMALEYLRAHPLETDLLLTDNMMPALTGIELCQYVVQERLIARDAPIVMMSGATDHQSVLDALNSSASDFLMKPFSKEECLARLKIHLQHRLLQREREQQFQALERKFATQRLEILRTQRAAIEMMGAMSEQRDHDTGYHIMRTRDYMELMANALLVSDRYRDALDLTWVSDVVESAPLHDIGKIAVPDRILLKPGKLTEDEFSEMKKHTLYGARALEQAKQTLGACRSFLDEAVHIAGSHHERWDGTGYPYQLSGEGIPLSARMMAIVDVYDALVSPRVYKSKLSHNYARAFIIEGGGKHFDPYLVDIFASLADQFQTIYARYEAMNSGFSLQPRESVAGGGH